MVGLRDGLVILLNNLLVIDTVTLCLMRGSKGDRLPSRRSSSVIRAPLVKLLMKDVWFKLARSSIEEAAS